MVFNIFRVHGEDSISEFDEYIESVVAPTAETAILEYEIRHFGKQSLCKPERWSHTYGRVYIGTRYEGFYRAEIVDCCLRCNRIAGCEKVSCLGVN